MAEKDLTKRLTAVVKGIDKLVQDVEKDIKELTVNAHAAKQAFTDIRDRIRRLQDDQEPEDGTDL